MTTPNHLRRRGVITAGDLLAGTSNTQAERTRRRVAFRDSIAGRAGDDHDAAVRALIRAVHFEQSTPRKAPRWADA